MVFVDDQVPEELIRRLYRDIRFYPDWTILLTWTLQEAARYIETLKIYEYKTPDKLKERPKEDLFAQVWIASFIRKFIFYPGLNR